MRLLKIVFANVLIAVFLYSNVAVMSNYPLSLVTTRWRLPIPWQLYDCFVLFGMFGYYEEVNRGIEIYGIADSAESAGKPGVVQLDVEEYFPFNTGEIQSRVWVSKHRWIGGYSGQYAAWKELAAKIRQRHNRLHPDKRVRAVGIIYITWPRSLEEYDALKSDNLVKHQLLFAE
jgi:hypothetical protein